VICFALQCSLQFGGNAPAIEFGLHALHSSALAYRSQSHWWRLIRWLRRAYCWLARKRRR
jgi:hypothetical protein